MDGTSQEQPVLNVMMFVLLAPDHHQIVQLVLNLHLEHLLLVLVLKILLKLMMYVPNVPFLVQPVPQHSLIVLLVLTPPQEMSQLPQNVSVKMAIWK
jgi:hypothetical protein